MVIQDVKVTIGVPVFNAEKYVVKCVESVFAQTLDGIELILVDDKGYDNSLSIIKDYISKHPKRDIVRIVEHNHNMGVGCSRNTIVREARGKYLFFLDSDDYISPNSINLLYNKAEETKAETVWGSTMKVDSFTGKQTPYWEYPDIELFGRDKLINYEYESRNTKLLTAVWNILFNTEFFRRNNLRFEQVANNEDTIMHYHLQPLITKAVLMSDFTYYYYIRPNSISNFQKRDIIDIEEANNVIRVSRYIKNASRNVKDKPYYPRMCERIMKWSFFMSNGLLKNRCKMNIPIDYSIIKELMDHPASLKELLCMKKCFLTNFVFYLIGKLPAGLVVKCVLVLAKIQRL